MCRSEREDRTVAEAAIVSWPLEVKVKLDMQRRAGKKRNILKNQQEERKSFHSCDVIWRPQMGNSLGFEVIDFSPLAFLVTVSLISAFILPRSVLVRML